MATIKRAIELGCTMFDTGGRGAVAAPAIPCRASSQHAVGAHLSASTPCRSPPALTRRSRAVQCGQGEGQQ